MSVITDIKETTVCGSCQSSKFMLWDSKHRDFNDEARGASGIIVDGHSYRYLVRCDYFKLTVSNPNALIKCEGYKAK